MISKNIKEKMLSGSMIRKMFEEGNRLRALHGAENVFDFSIGNPDLEPPQSVFSAISELAENPTAGMHAYMSNSGYPSTRAAVAEKLQKESGVSISAENICMTVGAAGALNAVLKSVLDPEDEVILLAPFFMEYVSYIQNAQGKPVILSTLENDFLPNMEDIKKAITPKTKAIIINSPNNPTGVIYDASVLSELNACLLEADHLIHVISDEPYIELTYDGVTPPVTLQHLKNLIVCYSWSKSLSLPGERIGYAAVSPNHEDVLELSNAIVYCNRTLGSVNAPAFFQKVIEKNLYEKADISSYEKRRNLLYDIVTRAGFSCQKPKGALYLFVKSPIDDLELSKVCAKQNLLIVPGSAFMGKGYFRLAFCVPEKMIKDSEKAFMAVGKELGLI